MLLVIKNLKQLDFSALAEVYACSLQRAGNEYYANHSEYEKRRRAEEDFYEYLYGSFFSNKDNTLFVWEHQGQYVSALRLEPFEDGMLVAGLETRSEERNKGFAKHLLQAVAEYSYQQGNTVLYAHVEKKNAASYAVHRAVGFEVFNDHAVYIDGTITRNAYTLRLYLD